MLRRTATMKEQSETRTWSNIKHDQIFFMGEVQFGEFILQTDGDLEKEINQRLKPEYEQL